jgi:hypothetical protein
MALDVLSDMEPILEQLDDEQLDQLITALSKRIKTPRKILKVLWGDTPEEPYEPYEYTFQTEIEYQAFSLCLEHHDGWCGSRTDEEVDRYLGDHSVSSDSWEDEDDAIE